VGLSCLWVANGAAGEPIASRGQSSTEAPTPVGLPLSSLRSSVQSKITDMIAAI
jgi:hypothetical protein